MSHITSYASTSQSPFRTSLSNPDFTTRTRSRLSIEDSDDENEFDREMWSPETSPTSSDVSSGSATDFPTRTHPSGSHSSIATPDDTGAPSICITAASPTSPINPPRSPKSHSPSLSMSATHPYRSVSAPLLNRPQQRTRGLMPMSAMSSPPAQHHPALPKSQPLSRALFTRMTDTPHAGLGAGLNAGGKKAGGKPKMIVATKPMRTTFELGLTASELARRA